MAALLPHAGWPGLLPVAGVQSRQPVQRRSRLHQRHSEHRRASIKFERHQLSQELRPQVARVSTAYGLGLGLGSGPTYGVAQRHCSGRSAHLGQREVATADGEGGAQVTEQQPQAARLRAAHRQRLRHGTGTPRQQPRRDLSVEAGLHLAQRANASRKPGRVLGTSRVRRREAPPPAMRRISDSRLMPKH